MCDVGDIIIVEKYFSQGKEVASHSFIVINDDGGEIQGLPYDIIAFVMSSYGKDPAKREAVRKRKMSYPANFPIVSDDTDVPGGNKRDGYVKADQFYFFRKDKIEFRVIGRINDDIFQLLQEFIEELSEQGVEFIPILDNL